MRVAILEFNNGDVLEVKAEDITYVEPSFSLGEYEGMTVTTDEKIYEFVNNIRIEQRNTEEQEIERLRKAQRDSWTKRQSNIK